MPLASGKRAPGVPRDGDKPADQRPDTARARPWTAQHAHRSSPRPNRDGFGACQMATNRGGFSLRRRTETTMRAPTLKLLVVTLYLAARLAGASSSAAADPEIGMEPLGESDYHGSGFKWNLSGDIVSANPKAQNPYMRIWPRGGPIPLTRGSRWQCSHTAPERATSKAYVAPSDNYKGPEIWSTTERVRLTCEHSSGARVYGVASCQASDPWDGQTLINNDDYTLHLEDEGSPSVQVSLHCLYTYPKLTDRKRGHARGH